jgi:hypothetical protein
MGGTGLEPVNRSSDPQREKNERSILGPRAIALTLGERVGEARQRVRQLVLDRSPKGVVPLSRRLDLVAEEAVAAARRLRSRTKPGCSSRWGPSSGL